VNVYTMHIEKPRGVIKQHPVDLGTDLAEAERIVEERSASDPSIVAIYLVFGPKAEEEE
jgi:hypothetical protein